MLFITEESELRSEFKITVLYFYAGWMPYHKQMLNIFNEKEKIYNNVLFLAIDSDYFKGLCRRFNIKSIPGIIILNNGKQIKKINDILMLDIVLENIGAIYEKK